LLIARHVADRRFEARDEPDAVEMYGPRYMCVLIEFRRTDIDDQQILCTEMLLELIGFYD
jgi:hypothetical protein